MHRLRIRSPKQMLLYAVLVMLGTALLFRYALDYTLDSVRSEYTDTVVVEALGEKNEAASGMGVTVLQVKTDDETLPLNDEELSDWNYMPEYNALMWSGVETKTFDFETPITSDTEIGFAADMWSGLVRVTAYGHTETLDLYAQNGGTYVYDIGKAPVTELLSRMWTVWLRLAAELLATAAVVTLLLAAVLSAVENEINWIKKRDKRAELYAFVGTFVAGAIAHGYMLTNNITNHDSMQSISMGADGISSGRWLYAVFGRTGWIRSPFIFPIIAIAGLAVCAVLLVRVLQIRKPVLAALTGALLVSHQATTTMVFYQEAIPTYICAVIMSVYAVYLIADKCSWQRVIGAIACLTVSLGGYQAYLPVASSPMLILLARWIVEELPKFGAVVRRSLTYLLLLVGSLVAYLLVTQIVCAITGIPLSSYRGLNELGGSRSLEEILLECRQAYQSFWRFNSMISPQSSLSKVLDTAMAVSIGLAGIWAVISLVRQKKVFLALCSAAITVLFPLSCNLVFFYGTEPYALMQFAMVCEPIALVMLAEAAVERVPVAELKRRGLSLLLVGVIAALVAQDACVSATEQFLQQKRFDAVCTYFDRIITRVQMLDGYTEELPIALVGRATDPYLEKLDDFFPTRTSMGTMTTSGWVNQILYWDWLRWGTFTNWMSFPAQFLARDEAHSMIEDPQIAAMPFYPASGSIAIVDGVVVVHFSNE